MNPGIYIVHFESGSKRAAMPGVVTVENDRVTGGDSAYVYVGRVSKPRRTASRPSSSASPRHEPGADSVFGDLEEFNVATKGRFTEDSFELRGHLEGEAGAPIALHGRRKVGLE